MSGFFGASDNPYSRMAVAKIGGTQEVTVETAAFRSALTELGSYLEREIGTGEGPVIAIVGDYGTGKTHLGMALQERAARYLGKQNQSVLIEATTSGGFGAVYHSLLNQFELAGIRARAYNYFAAVVADGLRADDASPEIVEAVRTGRDDATRAMQDHSLQDSMIWTNTKTALHDVTGHPEMGTALYMLIEGGYEDDVWQWLTGDTASEVLQDRGVRSQINTLDSEVAALAALARLHAGQSTRFVMIIDECERALPDDPARRAVVASALRSLIVAFSNADAMLFLLGLPDFVQALPGDVLQRLPRTIQMTQLTDSDVRAFIEGTHHARLGERRLAPFTTEVVQQLLAVTNGNPRKIIRFCSQLYDRVTPQGGPVTIEMVDDVVRGDDPTQGRLDVGTAVRTVIEAEHLQYHRQHYPRQEPGDDQDFVITADGTKCVVLVTGAVVNEQDMTSLNERLRGLRLTHNAIEFVVVIGRAIRGDLVQRLRDLALTEPLVFTEPTFAERLRHQLKAMVARVHKSVSDDPWTFVLRLLQQIDNQQVGLYTFLGQLENRNESLRSMLERKLTSLQDLLTTVARGNRTAGLAEPSTGSEGRLPLRVDRHFQGILTELAEVLPWNELVEDTFDVTRTGSEDSAAASWLRRRRDWRPVAVALLVRPVVMTFRTAVSDWYSQRGQEPDTVWLAQLEVLCRAYESATDYLPLPQLSYLSETTPLRTSSGESVETLQDRLAVLSETVSTEIRALLSEDGNLP